MLAFGSAITKPDVFDACARPGIERAREADSVVLDLPSIGSLSESYNAVIDRAAQLGGLEALVLMHQDTEIVSEDFPALVREALADPEVGLAGCVGAVGVRSIAWWEGSVTCASFLHRYPGGDVPSFTWDWTKAPPYARLGEVDTLDGFLLVLSPWAVRNVRFDEALGSLHGYDLDFCLQVRAAGRKVVTANFRAIHHHELHAFSDPAEWVEAHVRLAEKWEGRGLDAPPGPWRERALRAEAEAAAHRIMLRSEVLHRQARIAQLERDLHETKTSISWRLLAPLR